MRRTAREREKRERDDRQRQAKLAAKKAQQMVARAEPSTHPYLEFKGLEEAQGTGARRPAPGADAPH